MDEILSKTFIIQNNEMDVSFQTPHGEGDSSVLSQYISAYRHFFPSVSVFDVPNFKFLSKARIKYQTDFSSTVRIKENNVMDVRYKLIQPPSTTLTFTPIKDTFIQEARPTLNFGSSQTLMVGDLLEGKYNSFFQFDISTLKNYTDIYFVNIDLKIKAYAQGNFTVDIYEVKNDWEENSLTWINSSGFSYNYIKTIQIVDGFNDIDLKEYITSCISNGNYKINIVLKTDTDGYFAINSKEYPDATFRPNLSVVYRPLNWVGNLEEKDFSSTVHIQASRYYSLYSKTEIQKKLYDLYSTIIVTDPKTLASKGTISRKQILSKVQFRINKDFSSAVKIIHLNEIDNTLSKASISANKILSQVYITKISDFSSSVIIRQSKLEDLSSKAEIKNAYIKSKVDIRQKIDFTSSVIIQQKNLYYVLSKAEIKNAYIKSKVDIRQKNDLNSSAIIRSVNNKEDFLSKVTFILQNLYSRVKIIQKNDFSSLAVIIYKGSNNLSSKAILSGLSNDLNSSAIVVYKGNNNLSSKVTISQLNYDFGSGAIIYRKEFNNLSSKAVIKNAYILSKVFIYHKGTNDFSSTVLIEQKLDFKSKVDIRQKYDLISGAIVQQFDINEKMSFAYIDSKYYGFNHYSIAKIQNKGYNDLKCKVVIATTARYWRPNTYGGLKYNRRYPVEKEIPLRW